MYTTTSPSLHIDTTTTTYPYFTIGSTSGNSFSFSIGNRFNIDSFKIEPKSVPEQEVASEDELNELLENS